MTVPPGGPYGQDPYGANPYGQGPYWGGPPQGSGPQGPQGGPPPYEAVQTRRDLYVEYQNGWRELYNLRKDPWELNNLAGDPSTDLQQDKLSLTLQRLYTAPSIPPPTTR